jgi:heme A synthase
MIGTYVWMIIILMLVGAVIFIIASFARGRIVYKYPVRIFKTREYGGVKELNCKGGYIGRKNSASFFQIKTSKWLPWKKINLNTTPNPKYMDQDNRVYYWQIDLDTYVQMRRTFDKSVVSFAPVEQDVKYGAILDIQRIKEVLRSNNPWAKIAPYIALVLVFMAAIIGWWFVMQSKCPNLG